MSNDQGQSQSSWAERRRWSRASKRERPRERERVENKKRQKAIECKRAQKRGKLDKKEGELKRDVRVQKREQKCKTRESANERDVRREELCDHPSLYSEKRNKAIPMEQGNWKNREQPFPGLDRCHVEFQSAWCWLSDTHIQTCSWSEMPILRGTVSGWEAVNISIV